MKASERQPLCLLSPDRRPSEHAAAASDAMGGHAPPMQSDEDYRIAAGLAHRHTA